MCTGLQDKRSDYLTIVSHIINGSWSRYMKEGWGDG